MNNLAQESLKTQEPAEILKFPKGQQGQKMADKFDKGYVMSSRLYRNEVEPFLSDAAARVYSRIESKLTGFNKETDYISYSQLQGNKNLVGSRTLSRPTVAKAIKELVNYGVISIIDKNMRLGNKFKINEVSLVEQFRNETSSGNKLVQKVNQASLESKPLTSLETKHTIDIIYRYLIIDKSIYVHLQNAPLIARYFTYPVRKKQAEEKSKAETAKRLDDQFNSFWSAYPNKKNKKTAEAKFKAINFKKHSFDFIMQSLEKHKASFDWQKENGKYIPHPTTWINGERWGDEITSYPSTANQHNRQPQPVQSRNVNDAWGEVKQYAPAVDDLELGDME
ncbi:replication protein [Acinetobacter nectaris]|uniref:replication protein n=1 Tax=Acinetobacter nectaris TaxID=1219382 RepID=UPI001F2A19FD|nr:replication protein [Acinetobacter nectaris]MCF9035295.1 hypothetical protein [Acinetobacter nectaris]